MRTAYLQHESKMNKTTIKNIADSLGDEMARRMYHKLMMLKFLSEIKDIESGDIKALKGKEIYKFLSKRH